jgi:hypothetical protein
VRNTEPPAAEAWGDELAAGPLLRTGVDNDGPALAPPTVREAAADTTEPFDAVLGATALEGATPSLRFFNDSAYVNACKHADVNRREHNPTGNLEPRPQACAPF